MPATTCPTCGSDDVDTTHPAWACRQCGYQWDSDREPGDADLEQVRHEPAGVRTEDD